MMWFAIRRRRLSASLAAIASVAVATALGASAARAQTAEATASPEVDAAPAATARVANPFADHFPNVVVKTHEGRNVRFYDDLLKDKIVLINFMYATCTER